MRGAAVIVAVLTLATLAFAGSASAAELTVSNDDNAGVGSLRAALTTALANGEADTVTIDAIGTVSLGTRLPNLGGSRVAIVGPGAEEFTVSRDPGAATAFRIFTVNTGTTAEISGLTIRGGLAGDTAPDLFSGGGIHNSGTLTLREVAVVDNTARTTNISAEATGGGIANTNSGTLTIERSLVANNLADHPNASVAEGGGIESFGPLTIRNSTIAGNTAIAAGAFSFSEGGGLNATDSVLLESVTLADNRVGAPSETSQVGANLVVDGAATATLANTLVAEPRGDESCVLRVGSTITSLGHNLEEGTSCALAEPSDVATASADLGPLADNGGPTRTIAPGAGSPALDAGLSGGLATDQRGLPRPVDQGHIGNAAGSDGADIGALELADTIPPDTSLKKKPKRKVRAKPGKKKVKITFSFTASEPGVSFRCALDLSQFTPCSSPLRKKLRLGRHTFEVFGSDRAGNPDLTPARVKFRVKRGKRK